MKRWIALGILGFVFSGCFSTEPVYRPLPEPKPVKKTKKAPTPPKVKHTLKEVEDNNFSPEYMYPKTKQSTQHTSAPAAPQTDIMTKTDCIQMIGQEKFDHYAQMLGGESGAIKRCALLKAMQ